MTDEEIATVVAERDAANAQLLRATVGASTGLTPAQAARLQGATREEMEADAAALLREFGTAPARPSHGAGSDVNSSGSGFERGAAAYRAKAGIDENGQRVPSTQMPRSEWSG